MPNPLKQKPDFKRHDPKDPIHKWVALFIVFLIIYGFFTEWIDSPSAKGAG